jgi:tetratricopeptide (TPR) repeat protein
MKITAGVAKVRKPLQCPNSFLEEENEQNTDETQESHNNADNSDKIELSIRYKDQGCIFAEDGDFQSALNVWHKAVLLTPDNHLIRELKAQAYLHLELYMQALQEAQLVVKLAPDWAQGFQTLGRCQREMGEICLSLQNYKIAASLATEDEEIQNELEEVERLSDHLHQMRVERFRELENSQSPGEKEANSCIFHLSARASGLIGHSVTNSSTMNSGDGNVVTGSKSGVDADSMDEN